ncbi:MAG: sigma 54-interacting transcriptional regulator [Acidobacteria bacterium]|nr:sigma 54-interacting transcriptional regulator [Acidobacteriota bacterium]
MTGGGALFDASRLTLEDFRSADAPMIRCLELARAACRTELPILILGESGTGKTLLARAIHNSSRRAEGPFVSFNAAALSETLLDSQLFGHEKGAFTGAQRQVRGKFELADGGTLFIDEIADMNPLAQAKILRAVEYGEFERLGSERIHHADVRIISATHYPIEKYGGTDSFRRDLFFRISGLTLTLPALRERPNDLRALVASSILRAATFQGKAMTGLSKGAADALFGYAWPGNLRELDRVIHAAVAMTEGDVIEETAVLLQTASRVPRTAPAASPAVKESAPARDLQTVEREHVLKILAEMGGNKTRAARALGIARSTLERKLSSSK